MLREWIETGVLEPNETIHDVEIADALGVSRTPVREALLRLAHHGAVGAIPGRATRVTPAEPSDVELVYPPLCALYGLAAEIATPVVTSSDIAAMTAANEALLAAAEAGSPAAARRHDEEFHRVLVDRAANPYIRSQVDWLLLHVRRIETLFFSTIGPAHRSYRAHTRIVQAVRAGNTKRAAELTRRNVGGVYYKPT
jgi:DNA-binding GntR family transcriptional regulator